MDVASTSTSSSSSLARDVFINFRGQDTRESFVCHLHKALTRRAVSAYLDNENLRKGDDLSDLLKAILESKISIVVFSENYATSTWCLKELVQIMECKAKQKQIVMPIFYRVDPSHIRKQTSSFGKAFAEHERKKDKKEVQSWIASLKEASNISGWDSRNYEDDAKLIDAIVERVFQEVICMSSSSKESDLVGMDCRIQNMELGLPLQMDRVRKVGIWGMGGIGKTTIATEVYDRTHSEFDHCCLLENVKDKFGEGGVSMLKIILSRLLDIPEVRLDTIRDGYKRMEGLCNRKVLVVLDDVDKPSQTNTLLDGPSFGGGSRIIVTTRHGELLSGFEKYEAELLSEPDALKLFSKNAFRTNKPSKEYDHLSRRAVEYAQGLPLALTVLGSLLDNKSVAEWEEELEKIKKMPNSKILNVLRTSFDGLDYFQQKIFLDIACFFRGMARAYVTKFLDSCDFFPYSGLQSLVNRALVTITKSDEIEMHDLLQTMGRDIESTKEDGKRSRFWNEDAARVLIENTAKENAEGLIIELRNMEDRSFNAEAFERMRKLRLLVITNGQRYYGNGSEYYLIGDLKFLSPELRVLAWRRYPLKCLPSSFDPIHLFELSMCDSKIKHLWKRSKCANNLRSIDLSGCRYLKETPDLTGFPNLEILDLGGCSSLTKVHPSTFAHKNLVYLSLAHCDELKSLPKSIYMKSLKTLDLSYCLHLKMFPEITEDMEELLELKLIQTAIKKLPSSIERLKGLQSLHMHSCENLVCLPDSICNLAQLMSLDLSHCSKLYQLPENIGSLKSLLELQVSCTGLEKLPVSILCLKLTQLSFNCCRMKAPLSAWPTSIKGYCTSVVCLNFSGCNLWELSDAIAHFASLKILNLSRNYNLESLPAIMNRLASLERLELVGCNKLRSIPELASSISCINAEDCTALETVSAPQFPYDIGRCFRFSNCSKLVQKDVIKDIVETHFPPQGNWSRPFYLSLPGSEIPKQFIHRCKGYSITLQLPQNWHNKKFLGLAICAVTNKFQGVEYSRLTARCFYTFKGYHCKYRSSFYLLDAHFGLLDIDGLESNHILVGYEPWSEFGINEGEAVSERSYDEAKFEIELLYKDCSYYREEVDGRCEPCIEWCGVRFFFGNNEDNFGEPMVQLDDSERSVEGWLVEHNGSNMTSDTFDEEKEYLELSQLFKGANRTPSYTTFEGNEHSSERSKTPESWTQQVRATSGLMQGDVDDGYNWYFYSGGIEERVYLCDDRPGCWAKAIVSAPNDPTVLQITYVRRHTCWKTQPMLTHQVRITPDMEIEGPFDGFRWEKYAETDTPGDNYPRVYYVCSPQHVGGCMAVKEVQCSNDQKFLQITYRGRHTCTLPSTSIKGSDDSSTSKASDASSVHDQVVKSPSSPGASQHGGNVIGVAESSVDNNVDVLRETNSPDMKCTIYRKESCSFGL